MVRRPRGSTAARWSGESSESDEEAKGGYARLRGRSCTPGCQGGMDVHPARLRVNSTEYSSDEEAAGEWFYIHRGTGDRLNLMEWLNQR